MANPGFHMPTKPSGLDLKNIWRDQAIWGFDAAEQDARRILDEFSELELPEEGKKYLERTGHISQEPWRNHPNEAIINYFSEWFMKRFKNGETQESLNPREFQMMLEIRKSKSALDILKIIGFARGCFGPDSLLPHNFLSDIVINKMFFLGYLWGIMQGGEVTTHPHTMNILRSIVAASEKKQDWDRKNEVAKTAAQEAIGWMLEQWSNGEESDHATFAKHAYDKFKLNPDEISRSKFLLLVKEAAKKYYPHKVRGIKNHFPYRLSPE